jgi:hypothetical protein
VKQKIRQWASFTLKPQPLQLPHCADDGHHERKFCDVRDKLDYGVYRYALGKLGGRLSISQAKNYDIRWQYQIAIV